MYFNCRTICILILVALLGHSANTWAQILIPDEDPATAAPQAQMLGVKSSTDELDLNAMDWISFQKEIHELEKTQQQQGTAYIVSGSLVLIGSTLGFNSASESLERTVYSISQTLSVAAIGYGVYQYNIGSQDRSFYSVVENTRSLSLEQKNELLASYRNLRNQQKTTNRWIHFSTYTAIAALNILQASSEKDKDLKNTMYFLGGISALAAISVHF